ncbi:MAG: PspC domain-containing protein [Alistipes sp.]
MNHTINVSIAGVAFVLDSEGYELLKDYLVRIEVAYKDDPDGAEILSDIEARVSELILNRQNADTVVPPEVIREIIGQLGWPDGVAAQGPVEGAEMPENGADNTLSRRLYRNPDGAKLGGVCNGLAPISASIRRWCACCSARLC